MAAIQCLLAADLVDQISTLLCSSAAVIASYVHDIIASIVNSVYIIASNQLSLAIARCLNAQILYTFKYLAILYGYNSGVGAG